MKEKLFVSFSGGRTSGRMCKYLLDNFSHKYEFLFVFANTGEEHRKTLEFVDQCDKAFGLNLVWVEAVVHHGRRKGSSHKVVNFTTAARRGEPFEDMIAKYGIPNNAFPHCTRELKLNPMYSYVDSVWPDKDYKIAVGIRYDEQGRRRKDAKEAGIVYPLMDWMETTKQDVNEWWEEQPFNLEIEEREGNCKWCWKKSDRKHYLNIAANPEFYDFPRRMEETYPMNGAGNAQRVFFRRNRSTKQLIAESQLMSPDTRMGSRMDEDSGCSESCEAFGAEA